ncbi:DUF2145 domain-containing protein [Ottowia sp.]|jgi:hypothetical protein|uniref:DUF2145 domain-containing protein n=1 Tax=Ottowia sp. TaxID=1898956 RepID=UPI0025CF3ED6|nr:DUF2145 domain-containing protein [Ottowia sp.]MBK6615309.1 DUF2145 domain-containing protein [Ottowia sp.]MBK6746384.1 DUF2145 domain-containing protein [Ottowia sp.]
MTIRFAIVAIVAGAALAGAGAANAGRRCDARPPAPQAVERGMQLAQQTAAALDAAHARDGTRVVLLARAGQDLTKYGQHWSHVGWAYRGAEGPWRVVHKLNECGTDRSVLMRQGLGEFFLDDPWRYEAAWVAPPPALQQALWPLLQDNRRAGTLHQPRYSMVSYAWGTRYQQSNQWAIETLALAAEPGLARREQAQAWLRLKDYRPATLRIGALTRLGGRMTAGNVAFDDHPDAQRFADRIETVTADSVLEWLPRALQAAPAQRLAL